MFFLTLRIIGLAFALNIFSQFTRALGDAPKLLRELAEANFDGIFSIFGINTFVNQLILGTLLPNSVVFASFILTILTSIIIWINLRKYLIYKNSFILWIVLFTPSYSVWTCLPSKEATFIAFSLIYICFEANNIVFKKLYHWNSLNILLQRYFYILICIVLRGYAAIPYILLGVAVTSYPFLSSILLKLKNKKPNFLFLIILSSLPVIILIGILSALNPPFLTAHAVYLQDSFLPGGSNLSRYFLDDINPFELKNFIILPYLSLFPTMNEIFGNPKLLIYFFESLIYLILYLFAWKRLFNNNLINSRKAKFIQYLFILVTTSYLLIYGTIGAYNLGSSLRFRQNFVNIGHILPLLIFYNYRNLQKNLPINSIDQI